MIMIDSSSSAAPLDYMEDLEAEGSEGVGDQKKDVARLRKEAALSRSLPPRNEGGVVESSEDASKKSFEEIMSSSQGSSSGELDPIKIFEREQQSEASSSSFVAGMQSMDDVMASLENGAETQEDLGKDGSSTGLSFHSVHIREFPIVLGCNPATTSGPPVEISWDYLQFNPISIDQYERQRSGYRRGRRELCMPENYRIDLLRRSGFSAQNMVTAAREAGRIRSRRSLAIFRMQSDKRDERYEKAARAFRNVLSLGRIRKKEKDYLERACTKRPETGDGVEGSILKG